MWISHVSADECLCVCMGNDRVTHGGSGVEQAVLEDDVAKRGARGGVDALKTENIAVRGVRGVQIVLIALRNRPELSRPLLGMLGMVGALRTHSWRKSVTL